MNYDPYFTKSKEGIYSLYTHFTDPWYSRMKGDTLLEVFTVGRSGCVRGCKWEGNTRFYTTEEIASIHKQMSKSIASNTVFEGSGLQTNLTKEEVYQQVLYETVGVFRPSASSCAEGFCYRTR